MKVWFTAMGKWFLAKSPAVRSLIVGLGAAVVVTVGVVVGYMCLRSEGPKKIVNGAANASDENPSEQQKTPEEETEEPSRPGEPGEPGVALDEMNDNDTERVEGEEPYEDAPFIKTGYKLINGDFKDGINGFEVFSLIPENISYTVDAEKGFSIDIADTGDEDWHIQLKQGSTRLVQGKWYRLTLDAKSSMTREIICAMQRDGSADDNWISYSGARNLALKKQWNTYTIIFQMTENTDKNAVFSLSMGTVNGSKITKGHTIGIRNIKLEQLPDSWLDQLCEGDNLLKNGNFAYGDVLWQASVVAPGAAATSFEGGKAVFDISNAGTIDWHVQLKQNGITLEQGNFYRLTFKASSSVARTINVGFMDKDYVNWYGGGPVALGAEQTVTIEFCMDKATNTDVCMFLSMGKSENLDTPASVISLSELSLVKIPGMAPAASNNNGGNRVQTGVSVGGEMLHANAWGNNVDASAGATVTYANGEAIFEITNVGTQSHHVQFSQSGLLLEKGCSYEFAFRAISTESRTISVGFLGGDRNWAWYGGTDIAISPVSSGARSAEDGFWKVNFTMNEETDPNATLAISLGQISGAATPTTPHTVTLSDFSLKKTAEASVAPDPGPSQDGVIYVRDTDEQTTDEWGSRWIVNFGKEKYYPDVAEGSSVRITAKVYSENAFDGMMGACRTNTWAWVDTGTRQESGGEATWILEADAFMGNLQIQIYSMQGSCVEIRSIKVEVVPGPEEPVTGPEMLTGTWGNYIATENGASAAIVEQDGKQVATITSVGTEDYHVQLKQDGLTLEKGGAYKLTFHASSTQDRTIKVAFQNASTYAWYGGNDNIQLTAADQTYTVEFTVGEDKNTDNNITLVFSMGKLSDAPEGQHTVTLSGFSLVKVSGS